VLFFTIWFLWPRELDGLTMLREGQGATPDYAMSNARYVSVKAGKVEVESTAQEAIYDLHQARMDAKNVVAHFYNENAEKTKVTADQAFFYQKDRRVHLLGNVHSESPDGFHTKGPEAEYFVDKRFMVAPQPIEGVTEDGTLTVWGNRAESNLDERKVHLMGDARTHFIEPKRGLTKVRGDRAVMDRTIDKVVFYENVKVEQDKTTGTGERADIFYQSQNRLLKYMSLTGNVMIVEANGRYTRSQVAEFFAPTDTIVLSGFPSVYDGDDAVNGDRITLYRATGVVEVTATNAATRSDPLKREPAKPQPLTKEDEELIP
jgi:LPS export ABC transporter protein LptC